MVEKLLKKKKNPYDCVFSTLKTQLSENMSGVIVYLTVMCSTFLGMFQTVAIFVDATVNKSEKTVKKK